MSRRAKQIILGIFLLLLVIPAWHVGSNWNPPSPLRFRLVRHAILSDGRGSQLEEFEIEVLNTSTTPRFMKYAAFRGSTVFSFDPAHPNVMGQGIVLPAGGTRRGITQIWVEGVAEPRSMAIDYSEASTTRLWVLSKHWSLVNYLPKSQQERFRLPILTESTVPLEMSP
jgi:hypothetical protein